MKYKLIIDKNAEEEIIAIVHTPSMLTQQIENLVFRAKAAARKELEKEGVYGEERK